MRNRLTEGHLVRHYQGVKGGRDAALLDIAQDFALHHLHEQGLFDRDLVFKGGTALRKFRAGSAGRFSTDLDFSAPSGELALDVLQALDGVDVDGFRFTITTMGDDGRRGDLRVETPFGSPDMGAKIELSRHELTLPPEVRGPVAMKVHDRYGFAPPPLPVVRIEEAIAEKLARYRRVLLARDLYDLAWFAEAGAFDEALVRQLWVLKVYRDVVIDGRGIKPLAPEEVLAPRMPSDFDREDIGYLTRPVDMPKWINQVQIRYTFLRDLSVDEQRWCACNARDRYEVEQRLGTTD
ncbi:nucleotidyl transferase AbiEii/AbiGii toxin family protein [Nocardioides sp.]|uniref:nucleotidyl transferase AbiEii/AbiGii toxin family protein n=1 Tax=Nocardioides sp. TaxID=35761 RepID=UPI003567B610